MVRLKQRFLIVHFRFDAAVKPPEVDAKELILMIKVRKGQLKICVCVVIVCLSVSFCVFLCLPVSSCVFLCLPVSSRDPVIAILSFCLSVFSCRRVLSFSVLVSFSQPRLLSRWPSLTFSGTSGAPERCLC